MNVHSAQTAMPPVIYGDDALLIAVKAPGVPSQADNSGDPDMLSLLSREYGRLWLVHRLDRGTGGLMVFARTVGSAAALSREVQSHGSFAKSYVALVPGAVTGEGTYRDYLYHDTRMRKAYPVDCSRAGVKEAVSDWRALACRRMGEQEVTLMEVTLRTGRFHQIRAQFASRGLPLLGDGKYGSRIKCPMALWAYRLSFTHPLTGECLVFSAPPPLTAPWESFSEELSALCAPIA